VQQEERRKPLLSVDGDEVPGITGLVTVYKVEIKRIFHIVK